MHIDCSDQDAHLMSMQINTYLDLIDVCMCSSVPMNTNTDMQLKHTYIRVYKLPSICAFMHPCTHAHALTPTYQ